MSAIVRHPTPQDYHYDETAEAQAQAPLAYNDQSGVMNADLSQMELAAFEKGRMQGEMEAIRRIEAEAPIKQFQDNTLTNIATPDVVEINQLTGKQWVSALFGEICAAGYIVLMALWIDQYRTGGVGWTDSDQNGNRGMFNVHVIVSFIGLWFVSQAYITYRLLPIHMSPAINKAYYTFCHAAALTCFGLAVAASVMSNPGDRSWSMHAWTAYLAVFVYAVHAFYSVAKVLFTPTGVSTTNWNESRGAEVPAHATAEQQRDGEDRAVTLYKAGPSAAFWQARDQEANLDLDARNANLGASHPVWSEQATYTADQFFLVPRAKWAVCALFGIMASVLIGIGEWQMLLSVGYSNGWTTDNQGTGTTGTGREDSLSTDSNESIIIGCIGLATLAGTLAIGYAALPPRTTLAKDIMMQNRRTSLSTGSTVQNTRIGNEYNRETVDAV